MRSASKVLSPRPAPGRVAEHASRCARHRAARFFICRTRPTPAWGAWPRHSSDAGATVARARLAPDRVRTAARRVSRAPCAGLWPCALAGAGFGLHGAGARLPRPRRSAPGTRSCPALRAVVAAHHLPHDACPATLPLQTRPARSVCAALCSCRLLSVGTPLTGLS